MFNAQQFLIDGQYLTTADAKQKLSGPKPATLTIQRRGKLATRQYQIIDNPLRLSLDDWTRVKAVFVQGAYFNLAGLII